VPKKTASKLHLKDWERAMLINAIVVLRTKYLLTSAQSMATAALTSTRSAAATSRRIIA